MTARLDAAVARMDALIDTVRADIKRERESGVFLIQRHTIKTCACGRSYTEASWAELPRVGLMSDGEGGVITMRNCTCGSTLAIELLMQVTA